MRTLIVGLTTRSIAESAVHSGYQVIALDAFADLDQQTFCECYSLPRDFQTPFGANELFTCSRGKGFDAFVYTANLENHPEVVRRFARRHRVLGNSPEVLSRVRHWPTLFASLARAGYKTPETIYHDEGRQAGAGQVWLRKPVRSGGGHGISIYRNGLPANGDFMLQEYIPGIPCSASFVANGREAVLIGLTEQLIGRPEFGADGFRYCGNLLPIGAARESSAEWEILNQAQCIATLLTREFKLVGVNGFDFILTDGQVCLTEVNPRYSASMELIERAFGLSIFDLHVRAVTRKELPDFSLARAAQEASRCFFGKAILFAGENAFAPEIARWQERGIRDVPHPGENLFKGKPVCTLLADGPDRDTCFAQLVDKADALIGEIYAE